MQSASSAYLCKLLAGVGAQAVAGWGAGVEASTKGAEAGMVAGTKGAAGCTSVAGAGGVGAGLQAEAVAVGGISLVGRGLAGAGVVGAGLVGLGVEGTVLQAGGRVVGATPSARAPGVGWAAARGWAGGSSFIYGRERKAGKQMIW